MKIYGSERQKGRDHGGAGLQKMKIINVLLSLTAHHVSWSISKTSGLLVLTGQNKPSELGLVDPVDPADDFQRRQNPPRVAHIWKLNEMNKTRAGGYCKDIHLKQLRSASLSL